MESGLLLKFEEIGGKFEGMEYCKLRRDAGETITAKLCLYLAGYELRIVFFSFSVFFLGRRQLLGQGIKTWYCFAISKTTMVSQAIFGACSACHHLSLMQCDIFQAYLSLKRGLS